MDRLTAFDVGPDGSLSGRRVWADLADRLPDGICLDAGGNIWVANPLAPECVLVAEGGEEVQVVETTQPCFACALGGPDRRTLYCLTAASADPDVASAARGGRLEAVEVAVAGAGWP
jgi:sugar lactone lactonase YvrE